MTTGAIRNKYINSLRAGFGEVESSAMTEMVLEHFAGTDRSSAFSDADKVIDPGIEKTLEEVLEKLLQHIPVQHITGYAWFYNLKFRVNEHVLIPRPETEELVHEVISYLKKCGAKKVIDIGTGSGCIPISIKKNIPAAAITSVDISESALAVAKENAATNDVDVEFMQVNFLDENETAGLPQFDIIVSNPPYIPEEEKKTMDKNVLLNEPHLALFVPQDDPLIFYKKIHAFAKDHLTDNGSIFLEVHEDLAQQTSDLFSPDSYTVLIKKDIPGKERMLIITHYRSHSQKT